MIVFPDYVLDWIGENFGKSFAWRHVIILEAVAIGYMIAFTAAIMPHYPRVEWWMPLVAVGMLALFRFGMWLVHRFFGFDDFP